MSELLFEEFEEVSSKQWKQKNQYDLKGEDYNEKLVTKTRDGIDIKPFYHKEDLKDQVRIPTPEHWSICEKIYVASDNKSNKRALEVLSKGAESLWFILPSDKIDLPTLFRDINLKKTTIYIGFEFLSEKFNLRLEKFLTGKDHNVYLQIDIIGNLARSGNWFYNSGEDHKKLKNIVGNSRLYKGTLCIDGTLYQNAGATIPQELAYCLAHANEYLNDLSTSSPESLLDNEVQFLISTGTNYFFEIAKIRALRLLYATLAAEYLLSQSCHILAQPTRRDKTLYDYNVNLLRTTTQSMSAVLGGVNSFFNSPYDTIYHKNNEFSNRIARNQLLVLKHESYLDKVSNAADGSYYVEYVSLQLAEKAMEIFKEIEAGGGFLKQLKEGIIQKKIAESADKEQQKFDAGEIVLIGTNKFENKEDRMKNDLELYPFIKMNPRKTLIQPILEKRLSEKLEQERLKKE